MEAEAGGAAGSTEFRKKTDPYATNLKIVEKRQLDLAKTALYEKQALRLHKRFMEEQEEIERDRNQKKAELEHQLYEKTMKKVEDNIKFEQYLEKMVREEKSQIAAVIKEKDGKRQRDEEEKQAAGDRQLWFINGRKKYEKLQAEKRHEHDDDRVEDLKKKIKEKEEKHAEFVKETKAEQDAAKKEEQKKRDAAMAKVEERRQVVEKAELTGKKEEQNKAEQRRQEATKRREEKLAEKVGSLKRDAEKRREFFNDRQGVLQDDRQELEDKLKDKADMIAQRLEDMEIELQEQREGKAEQKCELRYKKAVARKELDMKKAEETAKKFEDKHSKPILSVMASIQSELNDENVKAQKEYVRLRNEIERQEFNMKTRKKFKEVSEKAESLESGDSKTTPSRVTRMRALCNMYFPDKTTPKDAINYDKLSPPKKQKVFGIRNIKCGLCEMDYISDNLPGIATRATIQKLRKGWMSKTDDPQLRAGTTGDLEPSPQEGESNTGGPSTATLYDKVRLCGFCFQFVRQYNRQQTLGQR